MAPHRNKAGSLKLDDGRSYFLASAFMSQNQEVRLLMRPPTWSALPLFGSGTKTRISVPAVIPKTGDTYGRHKHTNGVAAVGQRVYWGGGGCSTVQRNLGGSMYSLDSLTQRLFPGFEGSSRLLLIINSRKFVGTFWAKTSG